MAKDQSADNHNDNLPKGRVQSIDALRGFDMFWIIGGGRIFRSFADNTNSPLLESLIPQFTHVQWEGFRFWDLIMPLFLFIVGTAMPFSFAKRLGRGNSKRQLYTHIAVRALILFVLGMVIEGHLLEFDLSQLHIFTNTLQAIAAGYVIAAIIMLNLKVKWQILPVAGLLILYWLLMTFVPVPGHGAGKLTEEGNLAIYIDHLILGPFQDGTSYTWILSTMTFGCTVMLGVLAGHIIRSPLADAKKCLILLTAGLVFLGLGWLWGQWFPINKHLWTSSFVLYSAGWCYLLLAAFYLLIDVFEFRRWAFFFIVIGMNPIAVYSATRMFDFRKIGDIFVGGLLEHAGQWDYFLSAVAGFAVIWLILYWMYRKKSFVKI